MPKLARSSTGKAPGRAVFLDFDGVLFDTVREAYCVAMLASGRAVSADEADFGSRHYGVFRKHRFLITCATDYYYLLRAMDEGRDIEKRFRAIAGSEEGGEKSFGRRFFAQRKFLRRSRPDMWLSLNTPFPFLNGIRKLTAVSPDRFFIITTKDKATVCALMKMHGVKFLKKNIFGLCGSRKCGSKGDAIRIIAERNNVSKGIYVDDSAYHLSMASGVGGLVRICAGWGYVSGRGKSVGGHEALAKIKKFLEG